MNSMKAWATFVLAMVVESTAAAQVVNLRSVAPLADPASVFSGAVQLQYGEPSEGPVQLWIYPEDTLAVDLPRVVCLVPGKAGTANLDVSLGANCGRQLTQLLQDKALIIQAGPNSFRLKVAYIPEKGVPFPDGLSTVQLPGAGTGKALVLSDAGPLPAAVAVPAHGVPDTFKPLLDLGEPFSVLYLVGKDVLRVTYKRGEPPAASQASVPAVGAAAFDLISECRQAQLNHEAGTPGANEYVVCVDLTKPEVPQVIAGWNEGNVADINFYPLTELRPNRFLNVHVWHPADAALTMKVEGAAGAMSSVAGLSAGAGAAKGRQPMGNGYAYQRVAPRGIEFSAFEFVVKNGEQATTSRYEFRTRKEYRFGLRTGVAVFHSPYDRTYGLRESGDALNPGKQIVVEKGDDQGLVGAELAVGMSWFPCGPLDERSSGVALGLYAGLGVLSASAKGADALTSLTIGPELSIGTQFSLTAVAGVRRTSVLAGDYRVGEAVPASTSSVPTEFGLTPTWGIMLNLAPYVWDAVRKVQ